MPKKCANKCDVFLAFNFSRQDDRRDERRTPELLLLAFTTYFLL